MTSEIDPHSNYYAEIKWKNKNDPNTTDIMTWKLGNKRSHQEQIDEMLKIWDFKPEDEVKTRVIRYKWDISWFNRHFRSSEYLEKCRNIEQNEHFKAGYIIGSDDGFAKGFAITTLFWFIAWMLTLHFIYGVI